MSVLLPFLLIFPFVFFGPASAAHRQLVLQSTSATPSATALASAFGYAYIGCWNETTGPRNDGRAEPLEAEGKKVRADLHTPMGQDIYARMRSDGLVRRWSEV